VLAIGGSSTRDTNPSEPPPLLAYAVTLSGSPSPRVCILNTACGDDASAYLRTYQLLWPLRGQVSHLALFPMPNVADPGDLLLSQDVIFVGGGSVANMVAVWRVHGVDRILREAWHAGIVLAGVSAGAICWFEGGTTDSFGPDLQPFTAGLGLLSGSYCPHYDSEPQRRPTYQALVARGTLGGGIACDDGAAAHFAGDDLAEIVAERQGALGYQVRADGAGGTVESPLPARVLPQLMHAAGRPGAS
jgi:peptidase E